MSAQPARDTNNSPLYLGAAAQNLPLSDTLAINELIAKKRLEKKEVLHLGFGEALFPLHPLLKEALIQAVSDTRYGPVRGISELREAIAEYLFRTREVSCSAKQVIVGPGSKSLVYALLNILEGDVLLPTPSWVSYAPIAHLGGKKVISVQTDPSDNQIITAKALSHAVIEAKKNGANPRILILNSPGNPTGGMFTEKNVKEIANWAKENRITLISDEIYAELAHGWRKHISPFRYYPEGTIITGGLSKTFSAGGWRLGYAVLPATETGEKVTEAIRALGSAVWSAAATPVQRAAVVAFTDNDSIEKYVHTVASVFGYVTDQFYKTFKELDVFCPRPAGGFYLYPDFSQWRSVLKKRGVATGKELANYLLENWDIATLPASSFNEEPSVLRLRLSTSKLCEPRKIESPEEREKALWKILNNAEKEKFGTSFPMLTFAQKRWRAVIESLNNDRS